MFLLAQVIPGENTSLQISTNSYAICRARYLPVLRHLTEIIFNDVISVFYLILFGQVSSGLLASLAPISSVIGSPCVLLSTSNE